MQDRVNQNSIDALFGSDVSVHDPAIFQDPKDGTYYVFGSHFAVATSKDLIHWRQIASDGQSQKLYGAADWRRVLSEGYAHANGNFRGAVCGSTWAPDLCYHDGKYYMYVSLSTFGVSVSAIARVEADSVLGPYTNAKTIVTSSADGKSNCIDPQIFSDEDGRLWLVYGSFFGGIFIKELHHEGVNWGLAKESGRGTLLWRGEAPPDAEKGGPEGAFIFRRGNYYYLMISDGSLATNYHIRVARSTAVEGPYYDITGADVKEKHGKGNKLAGNWRFEGERGLAAFGHNCVYQREGEFFAVGHIRFDEKGRISPRHAVRVHRILFNEELWPLLSPVRYAGETLRKVKEQELFGSYDLILHDCGISAKPVHSSRYELTAEHTITLGSVACGTWRYQEKGGFLNMTLNGVTYQGVAAPAGRGGNTVVLTATSDRGRPLWAKRKTDDKE